MTFNHFALCGAVSAICFWAQFSEQVWLSVTNLVCRISRKTTPRLFARNCRRAGIVHMIFGGWLFHTMSRSPI